MLVKTPVLSALISAILPALFTLNACAESTQYQLEKVVEVSRHGVRPPTPGNRKQIEAVTQRSWPVWQTADGELTGHGYTGAWLKGQFESQRYRQLGLLKAGCPSEDEVYIRASTLQRTQATAAALSSAAFPGCGVPVHALSGRDPLFQYPEGNASPAEKEIAEQEALKAIGGDVSRAQQRLEPQIAALKRALCHPGSACPDFDRPWSLHVWSNGRIGITGLDSLGAMAETLRLAWSENLPVARVAFGQVSTTAGVARLLPLLSAKYTYSNDLPYAARRGGSILMGKIAAALDNNTQPDAPPDVRWLLYVASDINLAYLRTLLNFSWQQGEYPPGNIPPGGSLVFERWRDSHQLRYIRVTFQAQSLDQLRQLTPLSQSNPLLITEWQFPGCKTTAVGTLCPYDAALTRIKQNIDPAMMVPVSYPKS